MAHFKRALHHQRLHRLSELQQAKQVGGGAARAADRIGGLLMGHAEFVHQALQTAGFLDRVEVFALNVLDQRHCKRCVVRYLAHQHGNFGEPRDLRRAPAAFPRDQFVAVALVRSAERPHEERLHQALGPDRGCKLGKRLFVHSGARLVFSRPDRSDGQRYHRILAPAVVAAEQRVEAAAETFRLVHGYPFRISSVSAM